MGKFGIVTMGLLFAVLTFVGVAPWFVGVLELYNHSRAGDFARPWVVTDSELARIRAMDLMVQEREQEVAMAQKLDEVAARLEREAPARMRTPKGKE